MALKYAGIGSRKTPNFLKTEIEKVSKIFDDKGFLLRSGTARGCDTFFGNCSNNKELYTIDDSKYNLASHDTVYMFHPAPQKLLDKSKHAFFLMARNAFQILGKDLNDPVDFVAYWTIDGKGNTGGTSQAIRLARYLGIPTFNVVFECAEMMKFVENPYKPVKYWSKNDQYGKNLKLLKPTKHNEDKLLYHGYKNVGLRGEYMILVDRKARTFRYCYEFEFLFYQKLPEIIDVL